VVVAGPSHVEEAVTLTMGASMATIRDLLGEDARERLVAEAFPERITPMLATLSHEHFDHSDWVYERKLDGQRILLSVREGRGSLHSRRGERLDATYPELVDALEAARVPDLVADGEVVAFSGEHTSFALLQQRMGVQNAARARRSPVTVHAYLFDLLHLGGISTRDLRLRERKRLLREAIDFEDPLRYSAHRNAEGVAYLQQACDQGWEGLIAKDATSRYVAGRSKAWLKFKCSRRQELVVGGFTEPKGSRAGFGALLVGYHEEGLLRYAGKVGTGYDEVTLGRLGRRLAELEQAANPFAERIRDKGVHFVAPELVAEVSFFEWTRDGRLRHPAFEGLREDKDPRDVVREP
jgi:bifunctional non-homologous end joining protein LigD